MISIEDLILVPLYLIVIFALACLMKSKNIPLLCFKNGLINIVTIEDLIKDIIQKKQISVKSISIHNLAKTNNIKLKIIHESVFKKIIFHIKYNLITSFILLIKNQIKSRSQNFSYNNKVSVITLIDFYKLIINE